MKLNLLIVVFICCVHQICSQSFSFRHYQVEDNLSYNSVMCSLQDQRGFMWFGTKDGLNRFDGYSFKVFRKIENDPSSLGNNTVFSICEGVDNAIWIGTYAGLYRYCTLTEKFVLVPGTQNNFIKFITRDAKGNIWFIKDYDGVFKYDVQTKQVSAIETKQKLNATAIVVNKNTLWISATDGFLWEYNTLNNSYKRYDVFAQSKPAISHWIETIYDTGQNALLVGTSSQGVKLFNISTKTYEDILGYNSNKTALYVRAFMHRTEDEYWIATESGLYVYSLLTRKYTNYKHDYSNPYSISDNALYTLCKDREGGIWIGSYFGGLNYFPTQHTSFEKYFNQGNQNSLTGNAVREIYEDSYRNLWIGTEDNGLNKFNLETRTFTHFKPTGGVKGISHSNIHGLLQVGDKLWVGTFEQGLDILDIKTGKVVKHFVAGNTPNSLRSNFIETLFRTKSNQILVATSFGIYRFDEQTQGFYPLSKATTSGHFTSIIEDKQGNIWTGTTRDGLFRVDLKNNTVEHYRSLPADTTSLSCNSVNGLFFDSDNNLWVTTENGLNRFNPQTKRFTQLGRKHGFPSNVFYRILEDSRKTLWMSTSKGLCAFHRTTNAIETYTKSNGILSDQFNYNSAYKDAEGRMYFGSVKGLISFMPDTFTENTIIPPIYLTGIQVDQQELAISEQSPLEKAIAFTHKIKLKHYQSTFSIDFAALSFVSPETTEYMYILEGLDKHWTALKTNRKVYFTKLSPGFYTFKVKVSNRGTHSDEQMVSLEIEILPPFWASSWAYLFYSLVIGTIVWMGIRFYHNYLLEKNQRKIALLEKQKEKEIYEAKIEFFTNVTHEIRTPLTLIKAPLEDLLKKNIEHIGIQQSLQIIGNNTNRLLDLTNQLLDFRKTESTNFSLNFVRINISKFLQERLDEFYPVATFKQLQLSIDLPEHAVWAYVDKEAFHKILTNLIDNAVKYAESQVSIKLTKELNDTFALAIKNDGALIHEEYHQRIFEPFYRMSNVKHQRGTGIGLALALSLTELHEGSLKVNTAEQLNIFTLCLPIHHRYEFDMGKDEAQSLAQQAFTKEDLADDRSTILLVEDNLEIANFVGEKLAEEYHVLKATEGKEALEILKNTCVHLIISDVMMPIMDGFELCKAVKSTNEYAHIPIILLTAKNTLQSKITGLELGADAYIEKPFSLDYLFTQVSNLLINRGKIKEYFANSPLVHLKNMSYNKSDEIFLEKITEIILQNLDNSQLDVAFLADMMNMSRPTLYRKIKTVANVSPNELIVITRLKKAAELLVQSDYKIQTIATLTGFNSQAQFGRSFLKQFGLRPSEYAKKK